MKISYEIVLLVCSLYISGFSMGKGLELSYSTYLGGTGYDGEEYAGIGGIAVDNDFCAYVSGITGSQDFPVENAYQSTKSISSDVFITKFSSSGSSIIYSTYLGGNSGDWNMSLAIDSDKCAYIAGYTGSNDFPLRNAYQTSKQGYADAFVAKLSSTGSELIYSTYLGGSDPEYCLDIALGANKIAYITGDTYSIDFPTFNAYQASFAGGNVWGGDAYVACLGSTGSYLIYSTYLGGSNIDYSGCIAIDSAGYAYAAGRTISTDFPVINAYQSSNNGDCNIYIAKFSPGGSSIIYSTYLGGSATEGARDIAIDSNRNIYVTGETLSNDFPVYNAYQSSFAGGGYLYPTDSFILKFNSSGSALVYSTYLGGADGDAAFGISVDSSCKVYITGWTRSHNFPTDNAYQTCYNGGRRDSFITCLSSSGSFLIYSTYFGGAESEIGFNIAIDTMNCIYVSGHTESMNFPTANAYQASYAGNIDTFVTKIRWEPSPTPTPISPIVTLDSGDYNGDGASEVAVFRPSDGLWKVKDVGYAHFGKADDIPVSGDYDGDNTTDIAIFRPQEGIWAIRNLTRFNFGNSTDIPIPRDYDQDRKTDAAFFRPRDGFWSVRDLTDVYFGQSGDIPLPADYDGDGWIEAAVFRPSSGLWAIRGFTNRYFGSAGDIPVPADYDQDGKTEVAIFRPSTGLWAGILSKGGPKRVYLGVFGDIPVPANYDGGYWTKPAVFRPSTGLWTVHDFTRCWFGSSGDLPATK